MGLNNYNLTVPGRYGVQLPSGFDSMSGYGFGSVDAPDPLGVSLTQGNLLYKGNDLSQFPTSYSDRINAAAAQKQGFWESALGPDGWGGLALGAAGGLASAFLGMKQYGLAKQTLAENKKQFQMNYDAQKQMTNARLEDRQRARVAGNPGGYQSVGDYMATYGIK